MGDRLIFIGLLLISAMMSYHTKSIRYISSYIIKDKLKLQSFSLLNVNSWLVKYARVCHFTSLSDIKLSNTSNKSDDNIHIKALNDSDISLVSNTTIEINQSEEKSNTTSNNESNQSNDSIDNSITVDISNNGTVIEDTSMPSESGNNDVIIDHNSTNESINSNDNINTSTQTISSEEYNYNFMSNELLCKYKGKLVRCNSPLDPTVDIYLCGTMHIAKSSADMVADVIKSLKPQYIMLEICESRMDGLYEVNIEDEIPITFQSVVRQSFSDRSIKTFGIGLLSWMQHKAAKFLGNKLGGELTVAAREGSKLGSLIVLGDRLASVTTQRLFDRLNLIDKILMIVILLFETLTMSFHKISEYITKSENDENFILNEMKKFKKYLPKVSEVIISERDEYLTQSLNEIVKFNAKRTASYNVHPKIKVLGVIGAGHVPGIESLLRNGNIDIRRINDISKSSKHNESTWPGEGTLLYVNFNKPQ